MEPRIIAPADARHSRWRNLWAVLMRARADGIPHARVRVASGTSARELEADDEGFFSGWLPLRTSEYIRPDWIAVAASLLDPRADGRVVRGEAYLPTAPPRQLVISDIDDTVLQSQVTNVIRAARTLAFGNARTRLPFPGVAAFYHALRVGGAGTDTNPLFYVSSSPWNLHDLIAEFLEIQGIPAGPVLLRDLDINLSILRSRGHHDHKGDHIRRILETYPGTPVILIGDSGQQDPEIYHGIVHAFPERVRAVYIRDVTRRPDRARAIEALATEVLAAGSTLVLAADTMAAARHAAEAGLIPVDALDAIGTEKRADEGTTAGKAGPALTVDASPQ